MIVTVQGNNESLTPKINVYYIHTFECERGEGWTYLVKFIKFDAEYQMFRCWKAAFFILNVTQIIFEQIDNDI
jgi:hypothetical protein